MITKVDFLGVLVAEQTHPALTQVQDCIRKDLDVDLSHFSVDEVGIGLAAVERKQLGYRVSVENLGNTVQPRLQ